jgi:hypothetical protein
MQANREWQSRPDDERFTSLTELHDFAQSQRQSSRQVTTSIRDIKIQPGKLDVLNDIELVGPSGQPYSPSHWSFGQLSSLAGAPAGYLRTLPAALAADNLNYGLGFKRDVEDVQLLLTRNRVASPSVTSNTKGDNLASLLDRSLAPQPVETFTLRAATGPGYGRIWNRDITGNLVHLFGDGVNGDWRVPGEFGREVVIDKDNTTFYASDRDMFVFLANERNRVEIPNRRDGKSGEMARGFFVWNSEVGSKKFGIATFLFDYVCCNRIVWGADKYGEVSFRHTKGAPDRFLEQIIPALNTYANQSSAGIVEAVKAAQGKRIADSQPAINDWLSRRFSKGLVDSMQMSHLLEEGRPVETLWDATTALTAVARSEGHIDERVELERQAGDLMKLAA